MLFIHTAWQPSYINYSIHFVDSRTIWAIAKADKVEAWKSQTLVVGAVARMLTELKDENWMLPVMNVTVLDLRYRN